MRKFAQAVVLVMAATGADAATMTVDCRQPLGRIGRALKQLDPRGPNTVRVLGTCRENVVIRGFDRLLLIAELGAGIEDASGGQKPVLDIADSRRVEIRGFRISGGFRGVQCYDASLCRFYGNTIGGSRGSAVAINASEATFAGDTLQDAGDMALQLEASTVTAWRLTVQRSGGHGVFIANGSALTASELKASENRGGGIGLVSQSHLNLETSVVSSNGGDYGLGLAAQSDALLGQVAITGNEGFGVAIGDLSIADFFGGATVTGNSSFDIRCWGRYSVGAHLEAATYGTNDCDAP